MHELTIEIARKQWRIRRPSNLEELWNKLGEDEFGDDERLPYWVEVWPASLVLAQWLIDQREHIRGAPCLDVGCGLGLTSLVAAELGARVIGMDYEAEALLYAKQNTFINEVKSPPLWVVSDWRNVAFSRDSFPLMWAGDIVYEQRFIEPVARFITHCLHQDGRMWIAEPDRSVYNGFIHYGREKGLDCTLVFKKRATAFEGHRVSVNIWEIRKR